ncbi:MAG TPA: NUDIX domain-containing protein [Nitrososphaera sp.]|jgi:isopentenyldiphosphate isomerase|nr:NUDIX domain-containing protein [Nitrososphaera sp.]
MAEEILDIYDENFVHLGQMSRDDAHTTGSWHRTIHCWIVRPNEEGFVLFQKRGRHKKLFPNTLDITAAGHYEAGEMPEHGVREIFEELGIKVKFSELIPLGLKYDIAKVGKIIIREFSDVYLLNRSEAPQNYILNPNEVEGLVEIRISDGLRLFSGEADSAVASGIEWDPEKQVWNQIKRLIKVTDVFPRFDPYYYKIFIIAKWLLAGERYLSI